MQPAGFGLKVKMSANPLVIPVPPNTYGNVKLLSKVPVGGIKKEFLQSSSVWSIVNYYDKV